MTIAYPLRHAENAARDTIGSGQPYAVIDWGQIDGKVSRWLIQFSGIRSSWVHTPSGASLNSPCDPIVALF
ncbi:hypothetical protein Asppvi_005814 [Aspergillus pseudoviridinutans]|uniref:Uncharacterized protein n=1 Tax=Aspergillus pseudoviridinutans TaxID=1517512 RepID=A0A9P3BFR3_9EURO|nr:uncharacterized protein Asppvi_005814 [Aspergillus pseudoviridinutans]GIJ86916.1 hypothetical protein Asppvi_005814 [Aspergillus pseudoviridinutans]